MNQVEAVKIIGYLNAAGIVGVIEGQGAVWADALTEVEFIDAQEAARALARTRTSDQRWVTPADIIKAAQPVRRDRINAALDAALASREQIDDQAWWRSNVYRSLGSGATFKEATAYADQVDAAEQAKYRAQLEEAAKIRAENQS